MIFRAIFWIIVSMSSNTYVKILKEQNLIMVTATDPWGVKVERVEM